jgi:hypothetical protein
MNIVQDSLLISILNWTNLRYGNFFFETTILKYMLIETLCYGL